MKIKSFTWFIKFKVTKRKNLTKFSSFLLQNLTLEKLLENIENHNQLLIHNQIRNLNEIKKKYITQKQI